MSVEEFEKYFEATYGLVHLPFFRGSIKDAKDFAFDRPLPEKLLLVVYLHNSNAAYVNIFVRNVLEDRLIGEYLSSHAVIWPCDATSAESRAAVQEELENELGTLVAASNLLDDVNSFPKLLIYGCGGGAMHLLKALNGTTTAQEVMESIMQAEEVHNTTQIQDLTLSAQGWNNGSGGDWNTVAGWGSAGWGENGGWADSSGWSSRGWGESGGWENSSWSDSSWDNGGWGNKPRGENGEGCSTWGEVLSRSTDGHDKGVVENFGSWSTGKPAASWDHVGPNDVWSDKSSWGAPGSWKM